MTGLDVAIVALQAFIALSFGYLGSQAWPWDWRGRRREVTLTRERRPWE